MFIHLNTVKLFVRVDLHIRITRKRIKEKLQYISQDSELIATEVK